MGNPALFSLLLILSSVMAPTIVPVASAASASLQFWIKPCFLIFALPTNTNDHDGYKENNGNHNSNNNNNNNNNNNHLMHRTPTSLRNEYWVLRHGQSQANMAHVIASSPEIATHKYGLSEVGKEQAAQAGDDLVAAFQKAAVNDNSNSNSNKRILLLASDLLRAKETAAIVRDKLQQAGIPLYTDNKIPNGLAMEPRLRERWFGAWDETSDQNYHKVWEDDAVDPNHTMHGVESVNQVGARSTQCIVEWDNAVENCWIICVAHGDVLQILQTAFLKLDGSKHRTLEHLETAKLRRLELAE